jgi:hypothetical protein
METEVLIDKLKKRLPDFNFTMVRALDHPLTDDLVVMTHVSTNVLAAAFKFDSNVTYSYAYGPHVTFYDIKRLSESLAFILDGIVND